MFRLPRCRRYLRVALLAALALGMLIQPTLGALSELHDAEHAALAEAGDGHGHSHHGGVDDTGSGHSHGDGGSDPDEHAMGSHGLLHQGTSVSVTLPDALILPAVVPGAQRLPDSGSGELPNEAPDLPFRPPIA